MGCQSHIPKPGEKSWGLGEVAITAVSERETEAGIKVRLVSFYLL